MAEGETAPRPTASPSSADVADFLARNSDFLARHPELLHVLTPPSLRLDNGVLDFQRFVVGRLQADLARLRRGHDEVIAASRANVSAQARVQAAILAMLSATTLEHLVEIATVDLAMHLEVDAVVIGFESADKVPGAGAVRGLRLWAKGRIDGWLPPGRDALLIGPCIADPALFGSAATLVRSQALLRLPVKRDAPSGLLALGSREPTKFAPGQGSELLTFLARALGQMLRGWLERD
jgi:uncharacterized protein YigA (DUF484 family)